MKTSLFHQGIFSASVLANKPIIDIITPATVLHTEQKKSKQTTTAGLKKSNYTLGSPADDLFH